MEYDFHFPVDFERASRRQCRFSRRFRANPARSRQIASEKEAIARNYGYPDTRVPRLIFYRVNGNAAQCVDPWTKIAAVLLNYV